MQAKRLYLVTVLSELLIVGFATQLRLHLCWEGLVVLCAQRWHRSQQSESLPLESRTLLDNKSLPCRLLGPKYADSHSSRCRSVSSVLPRFSSSCSLKYLTVLPPLYARPPDRSKCILVFLSCSIISILKSLSNSCWCISCIVRAW